MNFYFFVLYSYVLKNTINYETYHKGNRKGTIETSIVFN